MSLQQFQSGDSLRAQRMTAEEAKSVIDLWQRERVEQTGFTDRPTVPDVAEGLDLGVEGVQRLLAEVRAQRLEEERQLEREQKQVKAERRLVEEEAKLAAIQLQRAEIRQEKTNATCRSTSDSRQKIEDAEPIPWEVWKAAQPSVRKTEARSSIRQGADQVSRDSHSLESERIFWGLVRVVGFIMLICVALVIYFSCIAPQGSSAQNGGCILSLPDGTSQPCGPDFDRAHPDLK